MLMKTKTVYVCEHCGKEFEDEKDCKFHEKKMHICMKCEHNFFLYGVEQNCDAKRCHFKPKKDVSE